MKILWHPNPLKTTVELDDHDREVLRLKVKIDRLENIIADASFEMDPEMRKWRSEKHGAQTADDVIGAAMRKLDLGHVLDDEERRGKTFTARIDERLAYFLDALTKEPHCGDCICVPATCTKCFAERLIGIDTIPGLGKHEATKINGLFGDGATIDDALQRLSNYKPTKGKGWERGSEEEFNVHVPRWTEEAQRAHEWLSKYKSEHERDFGDGTSHEPGKGSSK